MEKLAYTNLRRLLVFALLPGCGGVVYQVSRHDNGGVPFLPIVSYDVTTTTFQESWFQITYDKTVGSDKTTRTLFTDNPAAAARVADILNSAGDAATAIRDVDAVFNHAAVQLGTNLVTFARSIAPPANPAKSEGLATILRLPVASSSQTREQGPAETTEFVNVQIPKGGSAQGEVDLNENGTLAKTSGQAQDQLPGQILSLAGTALGSVPTTLLGLRVGQVGGMKATSTSGTATVSIKVTPITRTYKIRVSRPSSPPVRCPPLEALLAPMTLGSSDAPSPCRASIEVATASSDSETKKDDADNAIEIQGTVKLPKASASPTSSPK